MWSPQNHNTTKFTMDIKYIPVTYWIILALVAVFMVQLATAYSGISFTEELVVSPGDILQGNKLWGIVTNVFLHGGFAHLLFNCLALFFFGTALEGIIGRKKFLLLFLAAGVFASIFYVLTSFFLLGSTISALGASGAIFGVIGAMVALRPNTKVMFLLFPVPMPLWVMAIVFVLISMIWFGLGGIGGIAENAHLGGLMIGYVIGRYLKKQESEDPDHYWKTLYH
jgi:uncharacterized protein